MIGKLKSSIPQFVRQLKKRRPSFVLHVPKSVPTFALTTLTVASLLVGVRQLGWLQPLELATFDFMVRLRPDVGPDPRLLIVEITQTDIQTQKKWPLSDKVLAQVLQKLYKYDPNAIGLDLLRSIPVEPGGAELAVQFQNPKFIGITYIGSADEESVPPHTSLPKQRIGFSNLILDSDRVVRRSLMFAYDGIATIRSFSLQLALAYLKDRGIQPKLDRDKNYQLKNATFLKLQSTSGGYQSIDARGYQILLDYRSRRNVARKVTLTQVLNDEIDPSWVKDKIVLIGVISPGIKDLFYTPYSATEWEIPTMPGVQVHAQMVSQILSVVEDARPLFWFWSEWREVLWIGGWAIVGGILAWRVHNPLFLGLGSIAMLGVLFVFGFALFLSGGWIPLAAPAMAFILVGAAAIVTKLKQAILQHQMVMKLLGQQTSPEIANALWNNRDRLLESGILPGQKLIATMLMTDLKGFSTISEQRPPEVVMAWLNEYLAAMTKEVQHHQGVINKFTGDGMLALFGVPVPRETVEEIAEDARRAVACALAMGDRLAKLNRDWGDRGLPVVEMRVGIFTGPVMVGSLGGKERLEYGAIGDSVNIASRLESCEKDRQPCLCRILIAKETLVHIQQLFQVESWGPLCLKGKEQTVEVYRVIGHLPGTVEG